MSPLNHRVKRKGCIQESSMRIIVLLIISAITLFFTATYAMPSSLATFIEDTLSISTELFEFFFSAYYLASAISCTIGGVLTDKYFGVRTGSLIFVVVACLGQIVFTAGGFAESFWTMVIGRFLLGWGNECLSVMLSCYAVMWFAEQELGFVFGFFLMVGKGFGTSVTYLTSSYLYKVSVNYFEKSIVLGVSLTPYLILMCLVVLLTLLLIFISKSFDKEIREGRDIHWKQIIKFPMKFWFFTSTLSFCLVSVTTFIPCAQQLMMNRYMLTANEANTLNAYFNTVIAVSAVIVGLFVSKTGRWLYYDLAGIISSFLSLFIFLATDWNPYIPITLYAFHNAILNTCMWNLVVYLVDDYQVASGYACVTFVFNFLTMISNLIAGYLLEQYGSDAVLCLLLFFGVVELISLIVLMVLDKRDDGKLNLSASERAKQLKQQEKQLP